MKKKKIEEDYWLLPFFFSPDLVSSAAEDTAISFSNETPLHR